MATGFDVMRMLRPNGGYVITDDNFDSLQYDDKCQPVTKQEFENGFAQYDAWKVEQDAQAAAKKAAAEAKLAALGLTSDDLKALGL